MAIAVRPEDVRLHAGSGPAGDPGSNIFPGQIQGDLFGGTSTDYSVEVAPGVVLQVRLSSRIRFERGEAVVIEIPPAACWLVEVDQASVPG